MIWQNPWGWLGVAAIAVPILAHLLARRRTRRLPFPTLRFLDASRLMLARRDRLTDLALLAVRCGVLAAAAAALAQPWFVTAHRAGDLGRALARVVIVDTSASMRRATPGGGTALDTADREARRLAAEAASGTIEMSAEPASALAGAVAWLANQSGRREIVVVSDFQTGANGAIDAGALTRVPADIGVRLVRIDVTPPAGPLETVSSTTGASTTAHIALTPDQTDVTWTTRPREPGAEDAGPLLLAGASERAAADAAAEAARALGAPAVPADRPVAVVFPGFEGREALLKQTSPLTEPWMFDTIARLRRDPALAEAAVAYSAARGRVDGRDRLLLFSQDDAGSLASATLLARLPRAISPAAPVGELDPSTVPDDVLRRWQHEPGSIALPRVRDDAGTSDGRWLWGVALALLGLETWMRRASRSKEPTEVVHARVA